LGAERLDLSLSGQQAGAQLHHHVLVAHHIHSGDILLHPRGLEFVLLLLGRRRWTEFCNSSLLRRFQEVMACLAASTIASLIDALKADPWCLQRTLGPEKISATALNSTRPRHGTPLIRYLGAEVMPKCPSRARSLSVGIGASAPKDSISSASLYSFSPSLSLRGAYPSSSSSSWLTSWSSCYYCSAGAP
jgi:hypothetical protein